MSELFETFDEAGEPLGLVAREIVHRDGLWHRSSNVFLFHPDGRLYLQRRACDKDVCPDLWDLSVGEHLQPGESHAEGAIRGLKEELHVCGVDVVTLGEVTPFRLEIPRLGIRDLELQQCFRAVYGGPVSLDPGEVADARLVTLDELRKGMHEQPGDFTPWLHFHAHVIE